MLLNRLLFNKKNNIMITSVLLAVTIAAFGVYIYKFPPKKTPTSSTPVTSSNSICMDYSETKGSELSRALIREMAYGYRAHQLDKINTALKIDDAHSIWFKLETLKEFIYHLELNARKNGKSSESLGLRIYYSRYPEIKTWKNTYTDLLDFIGTPREKYEKLHTLVMIPTIKTQIKGETVNIDFNPKDITTYTTGLPEIPGDIPPAIRIPALGGIFPNTPGNSINIAAKSGNNILAQNHGSLIPPADGSGEFI